MRDDVGPRIRSRRLLLEQRDPEDVVDVAVRVDGGVSGSRVHLRTSPWSAPAVRKLPVSTITRPASVRNTHTLANAATNAAPSSTSTSAGAPVKR